MIYFISDTHFYHRLVSRYRRKNFEIEILKNIFNTVKEGDVLYHLGDFTWDLEDSKGILASWLSIPARKILVMGNHDLELARVYGISVFYQYFDRVVEFKTSLRYRGLNLLLTHYPASDPYRKIYRHIEEKVRDEFIRGGFDLLIHGHIHDAGENRKCRCTEDFRIPCFNVNVEYLDCKPVSIDEIIGRRD